MRHTAVIIGYGRMGKVHEQAYQECGVEVIAKITKESMRDPLQDIPMSDFVSVCTHDDTHTGYALTALAAGSRVVVEKPYCLTEMDLRKLYKASEESTLTCNLPLVHKRWPDASKASRITADYHWGRANQLPGWRGDTPGFSFVLGAGIHIMSLLLMMKGKIDWVMAEGEKTLSEIDLETDIQVFGEFVNGGCFLSHIDCGTIGQHHHHVRIVEEDRLTIIENYASDKMAAVKQFIKGGYARYNNSFDAHSVCFAIERAIKSGKRATVDYLT